MQFLLIFMLNCLSIFNTLHVRAEAPTQISNHQERIIILQGNEQILPHAGAIWVENGTILKVIDNGKSYIIKGIKPGVSEVRLSGKSIEVSVLNLHQIRTEKALLEAIKFTLGLRLEIDQGLVLVKGRLTRWKDWEILANACKNIKCQYLFQAAISEEVKFDAEFEINKVLSAHSLPRQKIEFTESPILHLPSKSGHSKNIERILEPYGFQIERDPNSIELAPLIKVQITVAEVKKDFLLQYGMKWPRSYQAQILPNFSDAQNSAFVQADFWERSGGGRVLASPNLLCRSGKDAEFVAGGEFPIKIINFKMQDVIWKKYGILLKVSPEADYSGRMSISLLTEVSSIDSSRTVDGVPGLFTNRVQSHFDLVKPRTIALSGLIKNEESHSTEGFPSLGNIPILGPLFSSKEFRDNKTELIIFVRPEIVNPDEKED